MLRTNAITGQTFLTSVLFDLIIDINLDQVTCEGKITCKSKPTTIEHKCMGPLEEHGLIATV